jgi:CelD/BcsL family acetyltransferase involved in cellulose biosynthesis
MAALKPQLIQAPGEVPVVNVPPPAADAIPHAELNYRVEVIADPAALAGLKSEWDALLAVSATDHPFLSHEWISSWWQCFGAGRTLHVLLVRDGARLAGIAPLLRSDRRMYGISTRCLEALYNPHTPRFDFIVASSEAAAVCRSIWNHLHATAGWDILELAQLRADSGTLQELSQLALRDGCPVGVWHGEQSPYIPFAGTFESYFAQLNYGHRSNVRRRFNRLQERGLVSRETITLPEQVENALNDGLRIEAAAWKARNGTSIGSTPEVESFYRIFAGRAAAAGQLRLLFLTVSGTRIAFAYGLAYRNKLYVLKTGYDPEYSHYSPYNLLCYLVFQDGFARGLEEYEFLGNNESWKLSWTRLTRRHDWLYIFATGWRGRLLYRIKFRWIPLLRRGRERWQEWRKQKPSPKGEG